MFFIAQAGISLLAEVNQIRVLVDNQRSCGAKIAGFDLLIWSRIGVSFSATMIVTSTWWKIGIPIPIKIFNTFTIKGVTKDSIVLRLFPFSLLEKAKQWFYANKDRNTTWDNCSTAFLAKFFPTGKTNALH